MKNRRRPHGEGSVYQRESDGKWVASIDLGVVAGKRLRRVLYAETEADAALKLAAARAGAELEQSKAATTLRAMLEAALSITASLAEGAADTSLLAERVLELLDRPEPDIAGAIATARAALETARRIM